MDVKLELVDGWFRGVTSKGATVKLGGGLEDGLSPMEALLMAAGGCTGLDVVEMLKKMRQPPAELVITVSGQRRETPPRYFDNILIDYAFRGDLAAKNVVRAIELSLTKYCSVTNALAPKTNISYQYSIAERGE